VRQVLVVPGVPDRVPWDEVQTRPFKVAADSPFADKISATHPAELSTAYKVKPASARSWDVGVSVVRTDVVDPEFGAVDPESTVAALGEEEPPPPKNIAQVDEETRSGELAMLVHLGIVGLLKPDAPPLVRGIGIELGAAVSADKPAFFAGLSVPVTRFFRLGWGYTTQRVTALDGQEIGGEVASKDDIRTRQHFVDGHYISLSISLGSISFFKGGD
jgi:hypothetical protein